MATFELFDTQKHQIGNPACSYKLEFLEANTNLCELAKNLNLYESVLSSFHHYHPRQFQLSPCTWRGFRPYEVHSFTVALTSIPDISER